MRAAVFYGPGRIAVEDVPTPQPGKGEILVETRVALTCGTDLKTFKRGHPLAKPPVIMGHEFAGVVAAVGEGVEGFRPGTRLVAVNTAPCGACFFCLKGQPNLCERLEEAILGFTVPGAFAEYVRIPERIARTNAYEIPESLTFTEAAFLEPLACVVHGQRLLGINPGDTVAIVGSGPVALLHLQVALRRGAGAVIVLGRSERKLELARRLGAAHTVGGGLGGRQLWEALEPTSGRGADAVIEAVGLPEAWEAAVQLARKGGRVMLFGGCPGGSQACLDTAKVHYGELTVMGAFHHTPDAVREALSLLASKAINTVPLVSLEVTLEGLPEAWRLMGEGRAIKAAVNPRG